MKNKPLGQTTAETESKTTQAARALMAERSKKFDPKAGTVESHKYVFEEVLAAVEKRPKVYDSILGKVISFGLEYYTYDVKAKEYRWVSQWNKDCFPETVKITIETQPMNHHKWVRMIPMPTGGACPE